MPSEIRYIVFRDAKVVQAIQSYLRRMNKPLPAGSILSCGSEQDVSLELTRFRITLAPDLINTEKLNVTERHDVVVTLKRRSLAGLQGILWDASIDLTPVQVSSHCRRIGCYTPFVRPSWAAWSRRGLRRVSWTGPASLRWLTLYRPRSAIRVKVRNG